MAAPFALLAAPPATAAPFKRVVVVLRENHSFDNYFSGFPGADGQSTDPLCADNVADPPHNRKAALAGPSVPRPDGMDSGRCHYAPSQLPRYWQWAREFTLCDRYFGELLAPSVPNYFALMGARPPVLDNLSGRLRGRFDQISLLDRLNAQGIGWRNYDDGIPLVSMFQAAQQPDRVVPVSRFFAEAAAGQLPSVSWLTPSLADSEHPPHGVSRGEAWTDRVVTALRASPHWAETAVFIVWDEWGGFNDHVAPPHAGDEGASPVRLGYRVPCLVMGGRARQGHVSHTQYSHASIVATICRTWSLPSLDRADAEANDLFDCFQPG